MDNLTKKQRHKNMQNIRSKGTMPEKLLMRELQKREIYFASHVNSLIGKPDIVFRRKNIVVFVDSCFWHACPYHFSKPQSNKRYWTPKIKRNKERDKEVNQYYRKNGWKVLRFWEHSIKRNIEKCVAKIDYYLGDSRHAS